ncbi:amidase [Streptomyces sp. NBC_00847]|uniref:amidase n=1 Tax=unclassified Streptomyces TaxID=2593676 RepID=UPI0022507A41|nr:amidase [Streptomyces sp. NBC_00847]MCX4884104.1 amidase [Streptomyces sp. NBC_00847]
MQPFELSLTEASRAVRARELSPVELTESVLARIAAVEGRMGAYVTVAADAALAAAVRAEREISVSGPRGPLHGIPMALKDLIGAEGIPTTASSRVRAGHVAERDSRVAERLGAAGAVLLGRTHTHEFAYGLTTPQTNNAWDHSRVAGGSSGGSAVAVAAGGATFAMGTDTGGSIRVPAALNGVVGLKPTYGLVSRTGVTSLSWSLDHVGPLARTVQDVALVLSATAGHDPRDPASVSDAVSDSYVRLCAPANITGVPALTLPAGHDHAGLPIGTQLMARPFHDATVLRVGRVYEESVAGAGRLAPLAA